MMGSGGNRAEAWYFERDFPDEIRLVMGVKENDYKDNHLLKQKVIDKPVKEINAAGLGLEIKPVTVKQGRRIVAIRFDCVVVPKSKKIKGKDQKTSAEAPALPAPESRAEQDREEKELRRLKERYPEEFAERFKAAMDDRPAFLQNRNIGAVFAEERALRELRDKHGIVK